MKRIVNSEEMKFCDSSTITHFGVPSIVLMERAALSVVSRIPEEFINGGSILIACGSGNNGADGLAAARMLHQKGCDVTVARMPDNGRCTQENKMQLSILNKYKIRVVDSIPQPDAYDCIIDALFGVGLSRPPEGVYAQWIYALNQKSGYKIAVDLPSGVSSDTGQVYPACFQADLTVTFAYYKIGQILYPGCEKCGRVVVEQIGITDDSWLSRSPSCFMPDKEDLYHLPHRPKRSNKGTFGRVLVIAGSTNMAGAALFCAKAAYRTGCGLVKIYTPDRNRVILQTALPEAIIAAYDESIYEESVYEESMYEESMYEESSYAIKKDTAHEEFFSIEEDTAIEKVSAVEEDTTNEKVSSDKHTAFEKENLLRDAIQWADVIAVGPGIGTGPDARRILEQTLKEAKVPLVLDADALNIAAADPQLLSTASSPLILTPHLGEMARLTGRQVLEIQNTMISTAEEFAGRHQLVVVLKDAVTVTASPSAVYLNTSGCSAMAKGGSGDVLTGMIAALLAQGMEPEKAAVMGVYIHGLAGEAAARQYGEYSVLAADLIESIGSIMKKYHECEGSK